MYLSVIFGFNKVLNLFWPKIRFKISAPHIQCTRYVVNLWTCLKGTWKSFPFPVPVVLRVSSDHVRACCIYRNNFCEFSAEGGLGRKSGTKLVQITGVRRSGGGPLLDCVYSVVSLHLDCTNLPIQTRAKSFCNAESVFSERIKIYSWSALAMKRGDRKIFLPGSKTLSATPQEN